MRSDNCAPSVLSPELRFDHLDAATAAEAKRYCTGPRPACGERVVEPGGRGKGLAHTCLLHFYIGAELRWTRRLNCFLRPVRGEYCRRHITEAKSRFGHSFLPLRHEYAHAYAPTNLNDNAVVA